MSTILITGGAGFIGSNLARKLLELGHTVRIIDNLATGRTENIADIADSVDFIKGDIMDADKLKEAVRGADYIFHEAAMVSVPRSVNSPAENNKVNTTGTLNILIAAKNEGVKRVIYASSSSVYGDSPELPKKESFMPNPLSPYAVSKLASENYCRVFSNIYGLETVSLRYFNVYGPHQNRESEYAAVIPKFITSMLKGHRPTIFGNGSQTRDFTFVGDVVQANILAMKTKKGIGDAFNIAFGESIDLNGLVKTLNRLMGKDLEPVHSQPREGDILHSLADITKAREELGYNPEYDINTGLEKTIEWYNGRA